MNQHLRHPVRLLLFVALAIPTSSVAVPPPSAFASSANVVSKDITSIRREVSVINGALKRMTRTKQDVEGISLEGTEATYWVTASEVRKVTADIYGETYRTTLDLYYRRGQLIYATDLFKKYAGDLTTAEIASQTRRELFFRNGVPIRVEINGRRAPLTSDDAQSAIDFAQTASEGVLAAR